MQWKLPRKSRPITGIESRATILGHLQRGGSPTLRDRQMASMMGLRAVECIHDGRLNRIVAYKSGQIIDLDIEEALSDDQDHQFRPIWTGRKFAWIHP